MYENHLEFHDVLPQSVIKWDLITSVIQENTVICLKRQHKTSYLSRCYKEQTRNTDGAREKSTNPMS